MLRWAKRNEDRFFEQIMPKLVAKSSKTASHLEGELPEEYKQDPTEIQEMLKYRPTWTCPKCGTEEGDEN